MEKTFVVYKSSAGSGKTFTLVKEYLKLALAEPVTHIEYKKILAVTFTIKAATEMKQRIISALKELSAETVNNTSTLKKLLISELGISEIEIQTRAQKLLSAILHNYSDFSISTIDSFTHRIIRTFAYDLQLPINFKIETDTESVFNRIIALLLSEIGKNEQLTKFLLEYANQQANDDKNWDPENGLKLIINEIAKEGREQLLSKLKDYELSDFLKIRDLIYEQLKTTESYLIDIGKKALSLIEKNSLKADHFYQGKSGICSFYKKIVEKKEFNPEELLTSYVLKTLNEDKWYAGKITSFEKDKIDTIKDELKTLAESIIEYTTTYYSEYVLKKLIFKNLYALGLVNELAKLTQQFKEEEGILFINEFNTKIANIVSSEPTPYIYERLGEKYKYYLLDEFQDTSTLQWQNLLPLIDNSLSSGWFNLIVGDAKQSIYRWRNSNVKQFANLPSIEGADDNYLLQEREATLKRYVNINHLNKNYRSLPIVVKFNNALFDFLSTTVLTDTYRSIYDKQAQEHADGDEGVVTIDFGIPEQDQADDVNEQYTLNYIQKAIDSGFRYQDICIIIRTNKQGSVIANYLMKQGVPIVSSDSLLLKNVLEIKTIIAFLAYLNNEEDRLSASVVINYLRHQQKIDETVFSKYLKRINAFKSADLLTILKDCGLEIPSTIRTLNLYDMCVMLVDRLELHISNPQYVRFFLDQVLTFISKNTSSISQFLDWWQRQSRNASVIVPDSMDAVNIMTVHASKGLEFPIVIIPFCIWTIHPKSQIWLDLKHTSEEIPVAIVNTGKDLHDTPYALAAKEEEELQILDVLNLLYVAYTRAVERLHIVSVTTKRATSQTVHAWLQNYIALHPNCINELGRFQAGEFKPPVAIHKTKVTNTLDISQLTFTTNHNAVEIKGSHTIEKWEEAVQEARSKGVLMHRILANIKTTNDVDNAIHELFIHGELNQEECSQLKETIDQLLKHPLIKDYYQQIPGIVIKNEAEILSAIGTILRPDRLVLKGDTAVVIDYKTGKKNATKYKKQLIDYEDLLLQMGYKEVKKILVYISENEVELI